ncbi:MAG: hypothetical protein JWL86_3796 [Rhizobium sp.]|nr:hypothetical protein [Rhizobium sp.]
MGQMQPIQDDVLSTFTRVSLQYRQKAASLGQMACVEKDARKVRSLLEVAVSWIQLAENEELLASEHRASIHIF